MKTLYFDCFAGISGDMALGAFIDLGVDPKWLGEELNKLNLHGYCLEISSADKMGIHGTRCNVRLSDSNGDIHEDPGLIHPSHQHAHAGTSEDDNDPDPNGDHPHSHHHSHGGHTHSHHHSGHTHHHHHKQSAHVHSHDQCEHTHPHRSHPHPTYNGIKSLIESSMLDDDVKDMALRIFKRIAEAEAKVHGKTLEAVHFHEVGATDSIVDIVGTALCIKALAPQVIYCSPVHTGSGFVDCAHGKMPVPAPATMAIISGSSLKAYSTPVKGELTTPTGAAILAELATPLNGIPTMHIVKTGYGAGSKDFEIPNMLRVLLGEAE